MITELFINNPKKMNLGKMLPFFITVHNTGNENSTARNERDWLNNRSNTSTTSFHFAVDEKEIIQIRPLDEVCHHAGDGTGSGNMQSIGIEMCEVGNFNKTMENTMDLIIHLMKRFNIPLHRVKKHNDWSGKICPRLLYHETRGWRDWFLFIEKVGEKMERLDNIEKRMEKVETKYVQMELALAIETEKSKDIEAPVWFVKEFPNYKKHIDTPKGTYDFWRTCAVAFRVFGFK